METLAAADAARSTVVVAVDAGPFIRTAAQGFAADYQATASVLARQRLARTLSTCHIQPVHQSLTMIVIHYHLSSSLSSSLVVCIICYFIHFFIYIIYHDHHYSLIYLSSFIIYPSILIQSIILSIRSINL